MAKSIMVQGTMSNAGKSLIAAGLCRVFKQDGYSVAPFKSQNMALNSYVTADGLEMGRAQVMQAEAAGIAPDVRMNPVLLKPSSDTGSQVIVMGEILCDMNASDYHHYKKSLMPRVREAYNSLASSYDIIVLEGAGSPAEINLKDGDIVNMGMAREVNAPVLLAGDIDRGGVFAQLYGTVALLEEEERKFFRGLIINKFRGDKTLLMPGVRMLEDRVNIPVVGVLPYGRLDLDDEDSLSDRIENRRGTAGETKVDLAVIRLPHLSNFTDFNVFSQIPGVSLRYVLHPGQLSEPDMILLPGTKNTMGDLKWLYSMGFVEKIQDYHEKGGVVFGICGGYQMMGERLKDPEGVEGGGEEKGLGLLPMETLFTPDKRRTQVEGKILSLPGVLSGLSGMEVSGYEIHMGQMIKGEDKVCPAVQIRDLKNGKSSMDGVATERAYGSYVHGFFDAPMVAFRIAQILAERKGIVLDDPGETGEAPLAHKEKQYDLLADLIRENLDMEAIYRILEEGVPDVHKDQSH